MSINGGMSRLGKFFAALGGVIFFIFLGLIALGYRYEDRILPSLIIGDTQLSGKTEPEVRALIQKKYTTDIQPGITVFYERGQGKEQMIVPAPHTFMIDTAVAAVMQYGKQGNYLTRGWRVLLSIFGQANVLLSGLTVTAEDIVAAVRLALSPLEIPPLDAKFTITNLDPFVYSISSSTPGVIFEYTAIGDTVLQAWQKLTPAQVTVTARVEQPNITELDAVEVVSTTSAIVASPINIAHYDAHTKRFYTWPIKRRQIADWIVLKKNASRVQLALAPESFNLFVSNTIKSAIEVLPSDAIFKMNASSTRVVQFVGSRPGIKVDTEATLAGFELLIEKRAAGQTVTSTPLIISKVEPNLRTGETNDLGIDEILGTGVSNYGNSPRNRILNIRNAVFGKLNGTLIAPDEEFSLVKTLSPFTLAAGYLPELVIKGDRITPEIAGGLCQVGTTMFRSAMNSGLPITARTNHGLVVSYYNDPANGNPGTDATIYDPAPDFRFKNDTGHHILIEASVNAKTGELVFSVWGTSDGRKGSYTPPKLLSWIPAGEFETIETADLPPGKKECQSTHPGAVASFIYTRAFPGKEPETREFKSTYRAVSARCFVGKQLIKTEEEIVPVSPQTTDIFPSSPVE